MEEALIRIRGELQAVGLHVEVRRDPGWSPDDLAPLEAGDYGVIVLSQQGTRIDIRAYAPGLETPVSQSAHTSYPGMDAEVVAVRAVEALRAAMIQFARNRPASSDPLPPAVGDFTRLEPPSPPPAPLAVEAPPPPPPPSTTESEPSAPPSTTTTWAVWLGAVGLLDFPATLGHGGIAGALWWQQAGLRVGVLGQRTLTGGRLHELEGSAIVERSALQLLVGTERALTSDTFAFAAAGVGAVYSEARARANPGFVSSTTTHLSPALSVQLGAGYRFAPPVGAFALAGAEVLAEALRLRFDGRDVAETGRPAASLTLGLTVDF